MLGVSTHVISSTRLDSGTAVSRAYVSRSERKIDARHCSWYMPGIVRHQPLESVSRAWFTPRRGSVRPRCGQAVQNHRTRREHTGLCSRLRRGDQLWMLRTGLHGPWMISVMATVTTLPRCTDSLAAGSFLAVTGHRSGAHTAGGDLKPVGSTWSVFPLPFTGAASC
jgi:hypothetical protein